MSLRSSMRAIQLHIYPLADKYKGKVSFYAIATNGFDLQMRKQLDFDIAQHHLPLDTAEGSWELYCLATEVWLDAARVVMVSLAVGGSFYLVVPGTVS